MEITDRLKNCKTDDELETIFEEYNVSSYPDKISYLKEALGSFHSTPSFYSLNVSEQYRYIRGVLLADNNRDATDDMLIIEKDTEVYKLLKMLKTTEDKEKLLKVAQELKESIIYLFS